MKPAIPMLPVKSMPASVEFYRKLGFTMERRDDNWGWALLRLGDCRLMLDESIYSDATGPRQAIVYLYPDDIDRYREQVLANGLAVPAVAATFYRMREVRIEDPDGNRLWVGQEERAGT